MIYQIPHRVIPSFALAAASAALGAEPVIGPDSKKQKNRKTKVDLGYHMAVRYYGPAGSFRHISAAEVLRGGFEPESVRGQIVVVGVTATGVGDTFATPFDRVSPGAEIFATAISNLLNGDALARTPSTRRIDAAATVGLPLVTIALMAMRRPAIGFAVAGFVFVLWAAGVFLAFVNGAWLSIAAPLASTAPLAVGYAAARYIVERQASGRIAAEKAMLAKFQSPLLLDHILREPRFLQEPVRQDIAVLFLDLSGFTGAAEALGPERSRDILGGMQTMVEREVTSERGIVINFMGDGVLAVFGLPKPQSDDAARALIAVERLHASALGWLADLPPAAKGALIFASAPISVQRSFRGTDRRATSRSAPRATRSTSRAGFWKWRSSSIVASSSPKTFSEPPSVPSPRLRGETVRGVAIGGSSFLSTSRSSRR